VVDLVYPKIVLRFDKAGNLLTQLFKLTLNSNKPKDIQLKVDSEGSRLSKFDTKKLIMFIELEIIIKLEIIRNCLGSKESLSV